jgi:chromosome condensin MukBEF ATPase and DNA-binding subunit MukB
MTVNQKFVSVIKGFKTLGLNISVTPIEEDLVFEVEFQKGSRVLNEEEVFQRIKNIKGVKVKDNKAVLKVKSKRAFNEIKSSL